MADTLDSHILHALHVAPRAPFRLVGEVVGASEQTVARRFRAMRRAGTVRVVGLVNPAVHGLATSVVRISLRPDRLDALAEAVTRLPEVSFANITFGGSEIVCSLETPHDGRVSDVLRRLARFPGVLGVDARMMLHPYSPPGADWGHLGPSLPEEAVARLRERHPRPVPVGPPVEPRPEDAPLLAVLAEDGRASQATLAERTGWTPGRIARRIETLERAGTLFYDVDLVPERLGYPFSAALWLRTTPALLDETGTAVAALPRIVFAAATSGEQNLMAIAMCTDAADFYDFLSRSLARVPGITGYSVSVRLSTLKQAASLVHRGRLVAPAPAPAPRR
ncbi:MULTISPECIES: Lrp/AsnC family transcriptional regulator [unclassified Streptomyces]|uniref:AsnC family transcriptional regulator n=1 Tax=Streptomyces evansiae TaxID=3075535 RepID=A0ABU2R9T0_9ACTN|nr:MULTISPECIES: Lrp/AsnC ligand binding domain-containing protein [unclassified Streptomyces]ASY35249.1 AsnC family transcriptional regulator [Streptomyces sp. CLI2509]MDT0413458.1 AsnC family transcriptional regulator [Streptomyces sp. DSM 41979]MDT0422445.1 AsnC family transcriptional regulator [Streptomyces sp. DSM 41859]MYQ60299.1 AsnC family transcriptional regulator [Streptomyces sp. SID4926]MYR30281.1 AsnC family transcriptional regulator [Streptomyces sp. SID4945]